MLTILTTTDSAQRVRDAIGRIDRLGELITLVQQSDAIADLKVLVVEENGIKIPLDWHDLEPPYVIPSIPYTEEHLLALIFYKLGNHQKAFEFLTEGTPLYYHVLIATHLQFGYEISEDMIAFVYSTSPHNQAILHHYGNVESKVDFPKLKSMYVHALEQIKNDELKGYAAKHYVNLLLDAQALDEAKEVVEVHRSTVISDEAKNAMDVHMAAVSMALLQLPYDKAELNKIQELQLQNITYYESRNLKVQAGLLLIDASEIANFKGDFIASKERINKAIQYFKEEDIPEFLGEAGFKKAILLYTWSKNGNPQYYKAAINAFQDVLKVFKRDTHPRKFADIHHNLALIYSEIPVGADEKPIWTAFCASSFKEVLAFYTPEEYPYENAMASHNYATALMYFPEAKLHNNLDKAHSLFQNALQIRTAEEYPFERALTLLNQLELGWLSHNENVQQELRKYDQMKLKAEEVKTLVTDKNLIAQADNHLKQLEEVRTLI
ncbi:MAG: hypothetical protein WBG90_00465 [Saonia sp.]